MGALPVTGAASQHEAEEQALRACNQDPQRGRPGRAACSTPRQPGGAAAVGAPRRGAAVASRPPSAGPGRRAADGRSSGRRDPYVSRTSAPSIAERYLAAPRDRS
jgi:hypothetical protein